MLQPWFDSCPCFELFHLPCLPQSERRNIGHVTGTQKAGASFCEVGFVLEEVFIREGLGSMVTCCACLLTFIVWPHRELVQAAR